MSNYLQLSIDSIKLYNKNFENFIESNKNIIFENNTIEIDSDVETFNKLILEAPENVLSNKIVEYKKDVINTQIFFEEYDLYLAKENFLNAVEIYKNPVALKNKNIINKIAFNDIELHEFLLRSAKNKNIISDIENLNFSRKDNINESKNKNKEILLSNPYKFIEKAEVLNEFLGKMLQGIWNFLKGIGTNLLKAWDSLTAPLKVAFKFLGSFIGCITPIPSLRSDINKVQNIKDDLKEKAIEAKKVLDKYFSLAKKNAAKNKSEQKKLDLEKPSNKKDKKVDKEEVDVITESKKNILLEWSFKDILNPLKELVKKVFSVGGFMELLAKVKNINFKTIWDFFTTKIKSLKKVETLSESYKNKNFIFEETAAEKQARYEKEAREQQEDAELRTAAQKKVASEKEASAEGLVTQLTGVFTNVDYTNPDGLLTLPGQLLKTVQGWVFTLLSVKFGLWGVLAGVVAIAGWFVWNKFFKNPEADINSSAAVEEAEESVDENYENANLQLEDVDETAGGFEDTEQTSGSTSNEMISIPGTATRSGQPMSMPVQQFQQQLVNFQPQDQNSLLRSLKYAVLNQSDDMLKKFVLKLNDKDIESLERALDRFKDDRVGAIDKFFEYMREYNQTLKDSFKKLIFRGLPRGTLDFLGLSDAEGVSSLDSSNISSSGSQQAGFPNLVGMLKREGNQIKLAGKKQLQKFIEKKLYNFAKSAFKDKTKRDDFKKLIPDIKDKLIDDIFDNLLVSNFNSAAKNKAGLLTFLFEKKNKLENLLSIRNLLLEIEDSGGDADPKDMSKEEYMETVDDIISTVLTPKDPDDIAEDLVEENFNNILQDDADEEIKVALNKEISEIVKGFFDFLESESFRKKYYDLAVQEEE